MLNGEHLAQSRAYCEQLTRRAARNFYYGLKLLPEPRRSAMFALYAYMRLVDDIADDADGRSHQQRIDDLETWRRRTHDAVAGQEPLDPAQPLWASFCDTVRRYRIPVELFDEVIAGQRQDLEPVTFATFADLRAYCYRVAGVVGLASIHIWGFDGEASTKALAVDRGIAFQLTNILRDLREDLDRSRVYLPRNELAEAGLSEKDLEGGTTDDRFEKFMRFQIDRAESFYRDSSGLEERIEPTCRATLVAMTEIYHGLLRKISRRPQRVLSERVSLSVFSKLRIGWRAVRTK